MGELIKKLGSLAKSDVFFGSEALVAGTKTIATGLTTVSWALAESTTASRAYVSAISGGNITVTGTGTDTIRWVAIGTF